jgi:solute carrier family 35 protein F5
LLNKWVKNERYVSLVFSWFALQTLVLMAPLLGIFHLTGLEEFQGPSAAQLGLLCVNGIANTVVPDYMINIVVVLVNPLLVSVGMTATMPLSTLLLYFTDSNTPTVLFLLGSLLLMVAVVTIAVDEHLASKRQQETDKKMDALPDPGLRSTSSTSTYEP